MSERPANEFKRLVMERTGLKPNELVCPREKSAMTPCIARDGHLAIAVAFGAQICVGCAHSVQRLLETERAYSHEMATSHPRTDNPGAGDASNTDEESTA